MSTDRALLTFSIGPVHAFIAQARKLSDLWTGSHLLSHLMHVALTTLKDKDGEPVFPIIDKNRPLAGLPSRLVAIVHLDKAEATARAMEQAVQERWDKIVFNAVSSLEEFGIEPARELWTPEADPDRPRQTDALFDVAWSWVPEDDGYATAARSAAARYEASRLYRPFCQVEETGKVKCPLCGERTALPDGDRKTVEVAWKHAQERSEERKNEPDKRFFRYDQTRLCLVCAAKRLYSRQTSYAGSDGLESAYFDGFDDLEVAFSPVDRFQPDRERPYYAVVALDGDRMGDVLTWPPERVEGGDLLAFHRKLSEALGEFSRELSRSDASRSDARPWQLDFESLGLGGRLTGKSPQLVYAGGEDVLFVCDPRDAFPLARAVRRRYTEHLAPVRAMLRAGESEPFTLSAAILFAHARHPAGLVFRGAEELLGRKAKGEAGRDAVALRLEKRGGAPVEVAFKWDERPPSGAGRSWLELFDALVGHVRSGALSSTRTFDLRRPEEALAAVLDAPRWRAWLTDRLERSLERGEAKADAAEIAALLTPFFVHGKSEALRILRFLAEELPDGSRTGAEPEEAA